MWFFYLIFFFFLLGLLFFVWNYFWNKKNTNEDVSEIQVDLNGNNGGEKGRRYSFLDGSDEGCELLLENGQKLRVTVLPEVFYSNKMSRLNSFVLFLTLSFIQLTRSIIFVLFGFSSQKRYSGET